MSTLDLYNLSRKVESRYYTRKADLIVLNIKLHFYLDGRAELYATGVNTDLVSFQIRFSRIEHEQDKHTRYIVVKLESHGLKVARMTRDHGISSFHVTVTDKFMKNIGIPLFDAYHEALKDAIHPKILEYNGSTKDVYMKIPLLLDFPGEHMNEEDREKCSEIARLCTKAVKPFNKLSLYKAQIGWNVDKTFLDPPRIPHISFVPYQMDGCMIEDIRARVVVTCLLCEAKTKKPFLNSDLIRMLCLFLYEYT